MKDLQELYTENVEAVNALSGFFAMTMALIWLGMLAALFSDVYKEEATDPTLILVLGFSFPSGSISLIMGLLLAIFSIVLYLRLFHLERIYKELKDQDSDLQNCLWIVKYSKGLLSPFPQSESKFVCFLIMAFLGLIHVGRVTYGHLFNHPGENLQISEQVFFLIGILNVLLLGKTFLFGYMSAKLIRGMKLHNHPPPKKKRGI